MPRRSVFAPLAALAGFSALFAVLPSEGSGVEVEMRGMRYRPAEVRIPAGGAITFRNEDEVLHTATCEGEGCPNDSGDIPPGTFKILTFPARGTYHIVCRYHGPEGMVALVEVGHAPGSRPTPAAS